MAEEWQNNERLAVEAVKTNLPEIQRFVEANLEIPESAAGLFGKVLSVESIEITDVPRVVTPPPWDLTAGKEITLTAILTLRIMAKIWLADFSAFAPPKVLTVGKAPKVLSAPPVGGGILPDNALAKPATLEFEAVYRDRRFLDLVPISVYLDTPKSGDRPEARAS